MKFSSVSIRCYITNAAISANLLSNKFGIDFKKSQFDVCFCKLDISSTNNFDDIYLVIRDLFTGREEAIKSINDEKDLFIMVEDDEDSGNFGIDQSLESLKYFSELGFAVSFDIYKL